MGEVFELPFRGAYPLGEAAELALEDYARALGGCEDARALRADDDPGMVRGLRLVGLRGTLTPGLMSDLEDFARDMAQRRGAGAGLGWT